MIKASEWCQQYAVNQKPWLIAGKGPTFRKIGGVDLASYNVLALNHVAREIRCDVALMMDLEVAEALGETLATNARFVFIPWHPHLANKPSERTAEQVLGDYPVLWRLNAERRLVVFNASTARSMSQLPGEPVTDIKFFSAEAALNILADNGARNIRTIGIDGGNNYASTFTDLTGETLLVNGQPSFDRQFEKFSATLRKYPDLNFAPVTAPSPIRIFIGADETQVLGAKIFEFSVRQYASMSVRCEVINNDGLPVPTDPKKRARTGFSFCRFKIPELCSYRGRGIYVDADMQVFTDIKDLWTRDFGDASLLYSELPPQGDGKRIPQFSVMLLNCAALDWDAKKLVASLESPEMDYAKLMFEFSMMPADKKKALLEYEWNSLEHYQPGRTKLLHYTDMPTQPWVSHANKNGHLWYKALLDAVTSGFVSLDEIYLEIDKGNISPMLPVWAGLPGLSDGEARARDWAPPYKRFAVR